MLEDSTSSEDIGSSLPLQTLGHASAEAFIVNGSYPYLKIYGTLTLSLQEFFDGKGAEPDFYNEKPPYSDAFWALEFKSSEATPLLEDIAGAQPIETYYNLTDRTELHRVAWGNDFPTGGLVEGVLDTRQLAEGYYDVRLWETDGLGMAHMIVYYIKVSRASDTPETGVPNDVGALTLSATDMAVPMSGVTVTVNRSYNSRDTYAPTSLGYGWRLGGVHLDIEHLVNQGSGEYDEANIRLPDGRKFWYANNPFGSGSSGIELNAWASRVSILRGLSGCGCIVRGAVCPIISHMRKYFLCWGMTQNYRTWVRELLVVKCRSATMRWLMTVRRSRSNTWRARWPTCSWKTKPGTSSSGRTATCWRSSGPPDRSRGFTSRTKATS